VQGKREAKGSMARRGTTQLSFIFRSWGGKRARAGRPKTSTETVAHSRRPAHSRHHPLHITLRILPGIPNLRSKKAFNSVRRALALANSERAKHHEHFRIVHYSVQGNHLHLIAEGSSCLRVSRGMQGLTIRIAKRLNLALGRRGRVFAERFHARPLRTPREVRSALAYVLLNERRHLAERGLSLPPWYFDPCSSAAEFDGWHPVAGLDPPPPPRREVTASPNSHLLRVLWRKHGLIPPDEVPAATQTQRHRSRATPSKRCAATPHMGPRTNTRPRTAH
jgi:hypothetical protein